MINSMCWLFRLLYIGDVNCHSEGAERLKNPYGHGYNSRDTSAKFILSLSLGPNDIRFAVSFGFNDTFLQDTNDSMR
jgi:hypothetical protein